MFRACLFIAAAHWPLAACPAHSATSRVVVSDCGQSRDQQDAGCHQHLNLNAALRIMPRAIGAHLATGNCPLDDNSAALLSFNIVRL